MNTLNVLDTLLALSETIMRAQMIQLRLSKMANDMKLENRTELTDEEWIVVKAADNLARVRLVAAIG